MAACVGKSPSRSLPAWLVIVACLLGFASPAPAQMRIWAGEQEDPITTSEIDKLALMLKLEEVQKEAILALHQGFVAGFDRAREEMRTIQRGAEREFERKGDLNVMKEVARKGAAFSRYVDRQREKFYEDLKLILTEEQNEQWPRFERYQRRVRADDGDFTQVSGSWVDLVELTEELELTPEEQESADPTILRYELELDALILERQKTEEDMSEGMLDEFGNMDDMEGIVKNIGTFQKIMDTQRKLAFRSRDVHASFVPQIMAVLPEEKAKKFERTYLRRAFPEVYQRGNIYEAFDKVDQWEGLSDEDKTRVAELREQYDTEVESLNKSWIKAIQKVEENKTGLFFMPGKSDPLLEKVRENREAIDDRYIEAMAAFLPPELVKELPEQEDKVDWRSLGDFDSWE